MNDGEWSIVPTIDNDGNISASRLLRSVDEAIFSTHQNLIEIRVSRREDIEIRELDELSDELAAAFADDDLVDLCRSFDTSNWCWYAHAADDIVDGVVAAAVERFEAHGAEVIRRVEPDGDTYRNRLRATPDEQQTAGDVQVLTALAGHGDVLDQSRVIDHTLVFDSSEHADAAASALTGEGFTLGEFQHHDDSTSFDVQIEAAPTLLNLRTAREQIFALPAVRGCIYDGWGCPVVKAPKKKRWFRR